VEKRHKEILRPLVAGLRRLLAGSADGTVRGDLDRELERLGLGPEGTIAAFDALPNPTPAQRRARLVAEAELGSMENRHERIAARGAFVERAAYGWINRLLALRVLEARGLIDETLRANPEYGGVSEALHVLRLEQPQRAGGADGGWWAVLEEACRAQALALPGLFALEASSAAATHTLHDAAIALRPTTHALVACIALIGGASEAGKALEREALAEQDAAFADPDAIGWAYQFYQEEAKAQVYARLKAGKKVVTRDEIAAATQLFTEPYMVQWLLQNSLGRTYQEIYPDTSLPEQWAYFIKPETREAPPVQDLADLTLIDPCMGSGHFLREAFDLLVAMYRERRPQLGAKEIADVILERHLFGIDIDPRAAQLAALTLYLRAWELVRQERHARHQSGPGSYRPRSMNLATTPGRMEPGALARHLGRHPEDLPLAPFLGGVFTALESADILGSLLQPRRHLSEAIARLRQSHQMSMSFDAEAQALIGTVESLAQSNPDELENVLLDRVAAGFALDARGVDDVGAMLFGQAAERGVRLLQLLDKRYVVVATNPPYMGSKNMDTTTLKYVERHFAPGKRDLYAAFILRNLELALPGGRVAMVTQQSWMFLSSYADLRAVPEEDLADARQRKVFTGLLRETSLETLAHLGEYAFEETAAAGAFAAMFVTANARPVETHHLAALRLVGLRNASEKAAALRQGAAGQAASVVSCPAQADFLPIPDAPMVYWLSGRLLGLLWSNQHLGDLFPVRQGLATGDNSRHVRCFWEAPAKALIGADRDRTARWAWYAKGGRYQKWAGLEWQVVDWEGSGLRIHAFRGAAIRNESCYFDVGLTYMQIARGSLNLRLMTNAVFGHTGNSVFPDGLQRLAICSLLNSRVATYYVRAIAQKLSFEAGHVSILPLPEHLPSCLNLLGQTCVQYKMCRVACDSLERAFVPARGLTLRCHGSERATAVARDAHTELPAALAVLHALEGLNERLVCDAYGLDEVDVATVMAETGTPVGWHPLLPGYGDLPPLAERLALPGALHERLQAHLATLTRAFAGPDTAVSGPAPTAVSGLVALKARLRSLYAAGPGAVETERDEGLESGEDDAVAGAYLPIPTETYLEELSLKLQIHPISVYWLLQEIRAEGARCKPEEQRLLEDRLSVIVLRLLGHRWPKQLEAGEPVPEWAEADGIIPLLSGCGVPSLTERVRARLRTADGDLGAQQAEALLQELTGQDLEAWLRRSFFTRHVRQFKHRPIAWHLASRPQAMAGSKRRGGIRPAPAFECLVYYHGLGLGLMARLRTQYLAPRMQAEQGRREAARQGRDEVTAAQATAALQELEGFAQLLRRVEEQGFACDELEAKLAGEPLDRWSGDGIGAPADHDDLLRRERAWAVDGNDGVRVNVAPLQLAGLLADQVLPKETDARKAIADRARWRSDERRWVREGVLPRCGWMPEDVPESPRWTERAPEREAERLKLERKRAEAMARLGNTTLDGAASD
jgi:hypothetical protein